MSIRSVKPVSYRPQKSSSIEFTIVTMPPRSGPSENPLYKQLKVSQEMEKKTWKGITVETVGKPGQGLHTQRGSSCRFLKSYENLCRKKLEDLKKEEDYRPSLVIYMPVSEHQLVKSTLPQNGYAKGNFSQPHDLLYRIYKTDARLVRSIFEASGFNYTDSHDWNVMWVGSSAKPYLYEGLNEYQRINHFPNSFELTRKDRMCYNIVAMHHKFGRENFDFIPETYILPDEFSDFYNRYQKDKNLQWILKPSSSSRGRGIYLIDNIDDVPTDEACVLSQYIQNPLLINGLKFDVRLYILVTSFDPLKIYFYEEGLARFASEPYTPGNRNNHFVHLTNYSVNKNNDKFVQNTDWRQDDVGHKWSLHALSKHLEAVGVDTDLMWNRVYDMVIKAILSIEHIVVDSTRKIGLHRNNCFDLFGFDVLIDSNLKPWLLEVNLSPSLATDSPLDLHIKGNLIADTFNLIGVRVYDRKKECPTKVRARIRFRQSQFSTLQNQTKIRGLSTGTARTQSPSVKKREIGNKIKIKEILREILEEYERRGGFLRIYPSKDCELYDKYFSGPRPINKALYCALYHEEESIEVPLSSSVKNFARPQTTSLLKPTMRSRTLVDSTNKTNFSYKSLEPHDTPKNENVEFIGEQFCCIYCKANISEGLVCSECAIKQSQREKIKVTGDDVLISYISRLVEIIRKIPEERLKPEWRKSIDKFINHQVWQNGEFKRIGTLFQRLEVRLFEMKEMKRRMVYGSLNSKNSEIEILEEVRNHTVGKCSIIQLEQMLKSSSQSAVQDIVSSIIGKKRGILSDIVKHLPKRGSVVGLGNSTEAESDGESFSKYIEQVASRNSNRSKLPQKPFSPVQWKSSKTSFNRPHTTNNYR